MPKPRETRLEHLPRRCRELWPRPLETSSKESYSEQNAFHVLALPMCFLSTRLIFLGSEGFLFEIL